MALNLDKRITSNMLRSMVKKDGFRIVKVYDIDPGSLKKTEYELTSFSDGSIAIDGVFLSEIPELWRNLSDWKGPQYEGARISTYGNFVSNKGRPCKPIRTGDGYTRVSPKIGGKSKNLTIHRLVAEAFLHKPTEFHDQVDHINEKDNNHINSLRWVTTHTNQNLKNLRIWLPNLSDQQRLRIVELIEQIKTLPPNKIHAALPLKVAEQIGVPQIKAIIAWTLNDIPNSRKRIMNVNISQIVNDLVTLNEENKRLQQMNETLSEENENLKKSLKKAMEFRQIVLNAAASMPSEKGDAHSSALAKKSIVEAASKTRHRPRPRNTARPWGETEGDILRKWIISRGFTHKQLGALIERDNSAVSNWCCAKNGPNDESLAALKNLGFDLELLMPNTGDGSNDTSGGDSSDAEVSSGVSSGVVQLGGSD